MTINPQIVIDYWIGDALSDPTSVKRMSKIWYSADKKVDAEIREKFGALLHTAEQGALTAWQNSPVGQLATIILLDQFTRNLYRGSAEAWKNDKLALAIAEDCVATNSHLKLPLLGRVFLYHPFHHAESILAQEKAVVLFSTLYEEAPREWKASLKGFRDFSKKHCDLVRQFGRFPHRNQALGRRSTHEEIEHLEQNTRKYGQ